MTEDSFQDSYLELSEDPVRFEPVNQLTNVFFDDSNKDVFTVRSGGVMGVVVRVMSQIITYFKVLFFFLRLNNILMLSHIKYNS